MDDNNLFGIDNDPQMIMLAQLNMLLNGDGNAKLSAVPDTGSINHKYAINGDIVELIPQHHKNGNWDNWPDNTVLKKFDVVLTNPPFGENRAFKVKSAQDKDIAELYELWDVNRQNNWIDKGWLFLENTIHILKENGRFGIVVSNSIASIERWDKARSWLLDKIRIVALFDLPANVFADTGVNTTLIIGYKPSKQKLIKLKEQDYEIFVKDIEKVGYEIRTSKRVKFFNPLYKINPDTFDVDTDELGNPLLDEEFSEIVTEFREWAESQEKDLVDAFIEER